MLNIMLSHEMKKNETGASSQGAYNLVAGRRVL